MARMASNNVPKPNGSQQPINVGYMTNVKSARGTIQQKYRRSKKLGDKQLKPAAITPTINACPS